MAGAEWSYWRLGIWRGCCGKVDLVEGRKEKEGEGGVQTFAKLESKRIG